MLCYRDDELTSTSSQIVEQIEVIQEVVLQAVPKLNDSATNKELGDQTQVSLNTVNTLEEENGWAITYYIR